MDRGGLKFLCVSLLALALPLCSTAWAAPLPFSDGFENVAVGAYPSENGWLTLSFGKTASVSDQDYGTGTRSFRLDSWPWSARMDYVSLDEVPEQLSYQASVCVDPSLGWVGLVGFMTRNGYQAPMWNSFGVDAGYGKVLFYGEGTVDLAPYTPGTWCTVRADLDFSTLTADLWVDDVLVAQGVTITPSEFDDPVMGHLTLSQWGVAAGSYLEYPYINFANVVYFDDLAMWQPEESAVIDPEIDIKPGSYPNPINLKSRGGTPVAIFSTDTFDATSVDPSTVDLAGAPVLQRGKHGIYAARPGDVDGDGLPDLLLLFRTADFDPSQLQGGVATLHGATYDGQGIEGSDDVFLVPRH